MSTTKKQLVAGLDTLRALADTIQELGEVPSGHLYASVMGVIDIHGYQRAIGLLVKSGAVRQSGDLLVWNVKVAA